MVRETLKSHPNIEICPTCGEAFTNISLHWEQGRSCSHPNYNPAQKATATGMLLFKGYLRPTESAKNSTLMCFFEREEVASALFELFGNVGLKTEYMDGEEFFGNRIRRKYCLFLRAHPYLTTNRSRWKTGRNKQIPQPDEIGDVSLTTFKFLYTILGERGYDGKDMPVFDCTRCDATPHHLRELLNRYGYKAFVAKPDHDKVVVREGAKFFDGLEMVSTEFC